MLLQELHTIENEPEKPGFYPVFMESKHKAVWVWRYWDGNSWISESFDVKYTYWVRLPNADELHTYTVQQS